VIDSEATVSFSQIWRSAELAYSAVLAQTLALSPQFRGLFINRISADVENPTSELAWATFTGDVQTRTEERHLDEVSGRSGRIDVLLEFAGSSALGIENKTFAVLGEDQLKRYSRWLQQEYKSSVLVFVAPSKFTLNDADKPPCNFVSVTYRELQVLATDYLSEVTNPFERSYFRAFSEYCGELEMKPLTPDEVDALLKYRSALSAEKKLETILDSVEGVRETKHGKYVLSRLDKGGLAIFAGFRIGIDWYYNDPLLNGRPEALVYVKDEEADQERGKLLTLRLSGLDEHTEWKVPSISADVRFYPRKAGNECRFAIRRNLESFETSDGERIVAWFQAAIECLLKLTKSP